MWQFCHFLFHPIGWFIGGFAGIGDNLGDGIITNFGDNLCDDFATICFTQYGDFFVDLPEMVRIEVIKLALYLVTIRVTDCQELDATWVDRDHTSASGQVADVVISILQPMGRQ